MRSPILPAEDEWKGLALTPASITWRRASDIRLLAASGYALFLQVSHPTVGEGVSQLSQYREDPIGRANRTSDFTNQIVYGGPAGSADMGRRVRELHKHVKGTKADGTPFHALEPEAYAWVHATGAEAIVKGHDHFGTPFSARQREQFWREWRGVGRFLGIRDRDLPRTWAGYEEYFTEMTTTRLSRTVCVEELWEAMDTPLVTRRLHLPGPVKDILQKVLVRSARQNTVGMMPAHVRKALGFSWNLAEEAEFQLNGAMSRALTPLLPQHLKVTGPDYARRRAADIARGETASLATSPHLASAARS